MAKPELIGSWWRTCGGIGLVRAQEMEAMESELRGEPGRATDHRMRWPGLAELWGMVGGAPGRGGAVS